VSIGGTGIRVLLRVSEIRVGGPIATLRDGRTLRMSREDLGSLIA
jgi:hypothetical protein